MPRITPFEAHIPEPYIVLGARLQPLTLGHAALMVRLGSGCWIDGGQCGLDELFVGVAICSSNSYQAFQSDLYSGGLQTRVDSVAAQMKPGDVAKEMELFAKYIAEGSAGPTVLFQESDAKPMRSHAIQTLRVQMMKFFRVPLSEVMDVQIASALWDMATLTEMNQVGKIWTDEDDEVKRKADEFGKAWAEKQNAGGANG